MKKDNFDFENETPVTSGKKYSDLDLGLDFDLSFLDDVDESVLDGEPQIDLGLPEEKKEPVKAEEPAKKAAPAKKAPEKKPVKKAAPAEEPKEAAEAPAKKAPKKKAYKAIPFTK